MDVGGQRKPGRDPQDPEETQAPAPRAPTPPQQQQPVQGATTPDQARAERDALVQERDLINAADWYASESRKQIETTAKEASDRTKELTQGYEGLVGMLQEQGSDFGNAAFDAALLQSSGFGDKAKAAGDVGAETRRALEQGDVAAIKQQQDMLQHKQSQIEAIDRYLAESTPVVAPTAEKRGPSKTWDDYWGTGGYAGQYVKSALFNPQRLWNTRGAEKGDSQFLDIFGTLTPGSDKNLGVGTEGLWGGIIGQPSGQALFSEGDKDIYESMSDEEIHELEAMTPEQQRQLLQKKRATVRGKK
jgi:hypothetical protein